MRKPRRMARSSWPHCLITKKWDPPQRPALRVRCWKPRCTGSWRHTGFTRPTIERGCSRPRNVFLQIWPMRCTRTTPTGTNLIIGHFPMRAPSSRSMPISVTPPMREPLRVFKRQLGVRRWIANHLFPETPNRADQPLARSLLRNWVSQPSTWVAQCCRCIRRVSFVVQTMQICSDEFWFRTSNPDLRIALSPQHRLGHRFVHKHGKHSLP